MKDRLFSLRFKLRDGKVSITAYDCGQTYQGGRTKIFCQLNWTPVTGKASRLFPLHDFYVGVGMGQTDDGDSAKESAVSLFCLKPGDTDDDFFKDYTPEQLEWVTSYGEELYMAKLDRFGDDS